MVRIAYNTKYDAQTGDISFVTECQHRTGVMVGSDACFRCNYFRSITFKQQVECGAPLESLSVEVGGFSTNRACNLSAPTGEPVQMKIQFK
jgi:hypothetical protein